MFCLNSINRTLCWTFRRMGKKRGKDKSSREEEEPDVIGSLSYDHQLSGHMTMNRMVIFMVYVILFQVHRADTLKREQTKLFSRSSLEILNGRVARIARMKKIKKTSITLCNKTVKKSKKHPPYGCAWNVDIVWVFLNVSSKGGYIFCKGADLSSIRVVAEILTTSMPSNTMKLHIQIHTVWWSVWTAGVCGEYVFCMYYPLSLGTLQMHNYILSFVRCYICNDEVHYSKTGHLAQLVNNLKKQAFSYTPNTAQKGRSHYFILHALFWATYCTSVVMPFITVIL